MYPCVKTTSEYPEDRRDRREHRYALASAPGKPLGVACYSHPYLGEVFVPRSRQVGGCRVSFLAHFESQNIFYALAYY